MIETFDAHVCAVNEEKDLNVFIVALAERADSPTQYVELQRSIEQDEQDIALGIDTYCVITSYGATNYGGITSCILFNDILTIEFTKEAEAKLGIQAYRISLILSDPDKGLLKSGLTRLFHQDKSPPKKLIL